MTVNNSLPSRMKTTLPLSVLDQVAPLIWLRYALKLDVESSNIEVAAKNLHDAIKALVTSIPPLGGYIDYIDPESSDSKLIVTYNPSNPGLVFTVRDFRYKTDPQTFKKNPDPPSGSPIPDEGKVPAFMTQANVFDDHIWLGIHVHHSFTDDVGANTIVKRLAETCCALAKGKKTPVEPFDLDRSRLSAFSARSRLTMQPEAILKEYLHIQPPIPQDPEDRPRPSCPVKRLVVNAAALSKLKTKLFAHIQVPEEISDSPLMSSEDALCAFLWHYISYARLETATDVFALAKEESTLVTAVDIRSKIPILDPAKFIGNAFLHVKCRKTIRQLSNTSLDNVAATAFSLHQAVDGVTKRTVMELVTALEIVEDFDENRTGAYVDNGINCDLTGMLKMPLDQQTWGPALGRPTKIRRSGLLGPSPAREGGRDGFVLSFTLKKDGSVELELGLREDTFKVLLENTEFGQYAAEIPY